jgi:hypothetical protein
VPQIRNDGGLRETKSRAESIWSCCLAHPGLMLRARHTANRFDMKLPERRGVLDRMNLSTHSSVAWAS